MLALTHEPLVGAGVDGAAVVGAAVGASVGAAVVGAAVVVSWISHSEPEYPALHWQTSPLQTPLPLQTVACLNKFIKRLAGDALFGPEMFAPTHDAEVGAGVVAWTSHSDPEYPSLHWQTSPLQTPLPLQTVACLNKFIKRLAGLALFGPEMLAPTHEAEVGAGVVDGAAVVGAAVGASVVVGATVVVVGASVVVGAAVVGAAVVDSTHETSHSSPSYPLLQTHVSPSQTPFPLHTTASVLFAGLALLGPLIFAEHEADVLFALLPGVALFGPLMLLEHTFCALT